MARRRQLLLTTLVLGWMQTTAGWGLTLDQALQEALANNPQIRQAKTAVEQAGGEKIELRSIALPTADLSGSGGVQSEFNGAPAGGFAFARGAIAQPLFDARIPASWRLGNLGVLIAQQRLNVAVTKVLHDTRVTFFEALYQRDLAALAREQRNRLRTNLSTEKGRLKAGAGTEDAVVRAEVQALASEPDQVVAEQNFQLARTVLAQLLGRSLAAGKTLPVLEGKLRYQTFQMDLRADSELALKQRPDLKLLRALIPAAQEKKRILQAGYFPLITLFASEQVIPAGGLRNDTTGTLDLSTEGLSAEFEYGAQLTWRVIDNGAVRGTVLQQQKQYEIDQVMLAKLEQNVPRDLARIRHSLNLVAASVEALQTSRATAEKNVTVVEKAISAGQATQLDFRQAEGALWQVQTGLLEAKFKQSIALAERDRALGNYFQFSFSEP